jgi:hypothetical protein
VRIAALLSAVRAVPDKHGAAGTVDEGHGGEGGDAAGPRLPSPDGIIGMKSELQPMIGLKSHEMFTPGSDFDFDQYGPARR